MATQLSFINGMLFVELPKFSENPSKPSSFLLGC